MGKDYMRVRGGGPSPASRARQDKRGGSLGTHGSRTYPDAENPTVGQVETTGYPAVAPKNDDASHARPLGVAPMRCGRPPTTPKGRGGRASVQSASQLPGTRQKTRPGVAVSAQSAVNLGMIRYWRQLKGMDRCCLATCTTSTHGWQGSTANQSQTPPSLLQKQSNKGSWDFIIPDSVEQKGNLGL